MGNSRKSLAKNTNRPMRIAFADPPYLGCANKYPEKQEVDHQKLILDLETYDGWALSCSTPSLRILLPMCLEGIRVGAWIKPFCSFKPGVNPAYAWEGIIFKPARGNHGKDVETVRDWVSANITIRKGLVGAKPIKFCFWLFDILGALPEDEFIDLFPGTGIVTKCWHGWRESKSRKQLELMLSFES